MLLRTSKAEGRNVRDRLPAGVGSFRQSLKRWLIPVSIAGFAVFRAGPAFAVIPKGTLIELETVASGLVAPTGLTHAGDGSGRLFIWDQAGKIRIVDSGGNLLPTPFLDVTAKLPALNAGYDERGLLGLAFHPDYEHNGRFFIRYSAPRTGVAGEPCLSPPFGCHEEILAEYHVSGDPNIADPTSEIILFRVNKPQFNHNSGTVTFGPDGYLYWTLGDGGGANDGLADVPPSHGPIGNAQNKDVPLGKILRIDVNSGSPYTIPPDNPFAGGPGLDEIYAYGLRNPFKFSFDSRPGGDNRLWLADVGQNLFEEVDIIRNGGNYGWVIREGTHCFDPFNPGVPPAVCPTTGATGEPLIEPIVDYSHAEGGISIIGGFVYRGACASTLRGTYVFGDFGESFTSPTGRLYYLIEPAPSSFQIRQFQIGATDRPYGLFLKGFGEDEAGNLYTCGSVRLGPGGTTGVVQRIVPEECIPVAVTLANLSVTRDAGAAVLTWEVTDARDHSGFHVFRETPDGDRRQITDRLLSGRYRYEYRDPETPREAVNYWLAEISRAGVRTWHGPVALAMASSPPVVLTMDSARPNPFQAATRIAFALPAESRVEVSVYDIQGRPVAALLDGVLQAGDNAVSWDGRTTSGLPAPAGFYVVRISAGGKTRTQKVLLSH